MCCFSCGLVLCDWTVDDDPWVEHAKHMTKRCEYVLLTKGQAFVDKCKRLELVLYDPNVAESTMAAAKALAEPAKPAKPAIATAATAAEAFEKLVTDIYEIKLKIEKPTNPKEEPNKCNICMENKNNVALIPCGHLMCAQCSFVFDKCPTCRSTISDKLKIYF